MRANEGLLADGVLVLAPKRISLAKENPRVILNHHSFSRLVIKAANMSVNSKNVFSHSMPKRHFS